MLAQVSYKNSLRLLQFTPLHVNLQSFHTATRVIWSIIKVEESACVLTLEI